MSNVISLEDRRATPTPAMLAGVYNANWKTEDAIAELIDNSFGEGRGNASIVRVRYTPEVGENGLLEIYDNGRGMDDLLRIFKLGSTIGRIGKDPGRYGQGGTKSLVWLGTKVEVISLRKDGKTCSQKAIWANWEKEANWPHISDDWETVDMDNVKDAEMRKFGHGVMIRLWLRRGIRPEAQKAKIAETFAPALRAGKSITWQTIKGKTVKREIIKPYEFDDRKAQSSVSDLVFVDTPKGEFPIEVKGFLVEEPDADFKPGVVIEYAEARVIIPRDQAKACFYDSKNDKPMGYSNITGRVTLHSEWREYLTTHKENVTDEVRTALYDTVFGVLKPLLIEAQNLQRFAGLAQFDALINDILSVDIPHTLAGDKEGERTNEDGEGEETTESAALWPKRQRKPNPNPTPRAKPEVTPDHTRKPTDTKRPGEKTVRRMPVGGSPRSVINWEILSDEDMCGQWCAVECVGNSLYGIINESCGTILDGFRKNATPEQKQAMLLVVLSELATAIASDEEFAAYIFPKHFQKWQDLVEDNGRVSMRRMIQMEMVRRSKAFNTD